MVFIYNYIPPLLNPKVSPFFVWFPYSLESFSPFSYLPYSVAISLTNLPLHHPFYPKLQPHTPYSTLILQNPPLPQPLQSSPTHLPDNPLPLPIPPARTHSSYYSGIQPCVVLHSGNFSIYWKHAMYLV